MSEATPVVLIPGLNCSARLYAEQIPALWRSGPVMVADHKRGGDIAALARYILAAAPPRFALVGFSLGGYIAFEMLRQAPSRIAKLALLDTSARTDTPEQTRRRLERIELAEAGRFAETDMFPLLVHGSRRGDEALHGLVRLMAEETGAEVFVRHQRASMGRADSRPHLAAIRCPTLVLVGDCDAITPVDAAEEIAAGVAGARLVVVPQCGHLAPVERPQAVAEALVEWIER